MPAASAIFSPTSCHLPSTIATAGSTSFAHPASKPHSAPDTVRQLTQPGQGDPPVHRDHDRAETHARELDLEGAGVAFGEDQDPVADRDAAAVPQMARQRADPAVELTPGE